MISQKREQKQQQRETQSAMESFERFSSSRLFFFLAKRNNMNFLVNHEAFLMIAAAWAPVWRKLNISLSCVELRSAFKLQSYLFSGFVFSVFIKRGFHLLSDSITQHNIILFSGVNILRFSSLDYIFLLPGMAFQYLRRRLFLYINKYVFLFGCDYAMAWLWPLRKYTQIYKYFAFSQEMESTRCSAVVSGKVEWVFVNNVAKVTRMASSWSVSFNLNVTEHYSQASPGTFFPGEIKVLFVSDLSGFCGSRIEFFCLCDYKDW